MSRKPKTLPVDDDNPEWTADEAAAARRLPELPATLQAKLRGRPKSAVVKARLTVRVEPQALERWRASGPGWQTRLAALVARMAP
ncbi:MAG: BrnA antitoxin family protein [Betaproteobacteria bacterium]|jgi:uncharacterized protein (DUF4415 family)